MTRASRIATCLSAAGVASAGLSGCGSATRATPIHPPAAQLQSFQLAQVGSPHADSGRNWQQYGARPVGSILTINPMTLYNTGKAPLVLLGIRQARPARGLVFRSEMVTLTPGFSAYSEFVSRGQPANAFGAHANFSPLRGFVVDPNPPARMGALTPTVVLTATAQRPGMFHIGDWVVTYRVGSIQHTLTLVDDGMFCAGAKGCPSL
jgi:hypothetical protein